jgi:5,10-methylene-tetrahydrofolate dehydrogenase/methenyl tetrahydrofolate cyclohydrolase
MDGVLLQKKKSQITMKMWSITKNDELRSSMYLTMKEKSSSLHHQKD